MEPQPTPRKLLDQVRDTLRLKHYSYRTEQSYVGWITRYVLFHNKRHPNDMGATIYQALGIDPASMIPDQLNRPRHVSRGEVMDALYTGAPT